MNYIYNSYAWSDLASNPTSMSRTQLDLTNLNSYLEGTCEQLLFRKSEIIISYPPSKFQYSNNIYLDYPTAWCLHKNATGRNLTRLDHVVM